MYHGADSPAILVVRSGSEPLMGIRSSATEGILRPPRKGSRGVPLLCHMLRSTRIQVQEVAYYDKVLSVRAGCRQVIDVSGDCRREHLQAV